MSFFTQMAGLAVQNFVSAAVGIAVAVALIRGLVRRRSATIGNFWVDLTRTVIRVLLPISIVFGLFFVSQGMVQNFHGDRTVATVDGGSQTITGGPVAEPGGHQRVRDERGRLLQRERVSPVREPESPDRLGRDPAPSGDPVRTHLHVRTPRRRSTSGLGRLRRHVRAVGRFGRRGDRVRGARQPPARRTRRHADSDLAASRRKPRGEGSQVRTCSIGPVRGAPRRARRRAR